MDKRQKLIKDYSYLLWYVPEESKQKINDKALVEMILSNGDWKGVQRLIDVVGINKVADIFFEQISGKRSNYGNKLSISSPYILTDMSHKEILTGKALSEVVAEADTVFGEKFNERLLREQLSYFDDINYDEEVEYIIPAPSVDEIKAYLTRVSVS